MTEAYKCDFCGKVYEMGELSPLGTVQVIKGRKIKQGSICASCCPDKWREQVFSDIALEREELKG